MWCALLTWCAETTRLIRKSASFTVNTMDDNMTSARHDFNISPATRIGYVSLNVSDIDRSLDFYEKVLGFKKVYRPSNERTLLSVDGHPSYLIELLQKGAQATRPAWLRLEGQGCITLQYYFRRENI